MITIEKINEAFIRVMSDIAIETDIKEHFTYKMPGYRWHPKFKSGLWSGDISLYNMQTKRLPIGLYPRLIKFIEDSNLEYKIRENDDYSFDTSDITIEEISEYIDSLDVSLPNNSKVRDYQIDAIYNTIKQKKLTLLSPTSSGKSLIIYCIIRYILDQNPHAKIILMVPSVQLVNQMFNDFEEYSENNGFDVAKYTQKLFSGQPKELTKNLLITTWQSLKNIAASPTNGPMIMGEYTAVFADEAHSSSAKEVQAILEKCKNAVYRIGTTGTLNNEKIHQLMIEGFLGPVYKVISTKELIDTQQVSDLDIRCFSLKYPEAIAKSFKKVNYADEINFLVTLNKRNDFICKMALAATGTTLILVNHVNDHAKPLYDKLKEMSDKPVYYVSGQVSAQRREEIRKVANMEDCIIVGTYGTLQQGVNIPNIRNVIFGCPSKSPIRVLQSIGRGLRLHKDKDKMVLIDLIDDIRHKKNENYSYLHGLERISIYRKEKFNITIKEIPFNV